MTPTQPIEQWFGIEPAYIPPTPVRTREQRAKDREPPPEPKDMYDNQIQPDEAWFRHHNWKEKRKVVREALHAGDASPNALFAFDNCGAGCQVEFSKDQNRYRIVGSYCHSRHCEPCMKAKSALITNNLRTKMGDIKTKTFHFITLTLAHDKKRTVKEQIARLYACYKKLRNTDEWIYGQMQADKIYKAQSSGTKHSEAIKHVSVKGQAGGAATLEIKYTEAGHRKARDGTTYWYEGGWHPHLHIISDGTAITDHRLKDLWYAITGDSWECDCRRISADKDVAYYVGKYVTKGTNDAVWTNPARAADFVKAVKGVRMCATFGTWRGYKLLAREKEVPGTWTHIDSLAAICRKARAGDEWALRLLCESIEPMQYDPHRKRTLKPK